eukprot:6172343-Pleurochrysis_carterae.AAC.2
MGRQGPAGDPYAVFSAVCHSSADAMLPPPPRTKIIDMTKYKAVNLIFNLATADARKSRGRLATCAAKLAFRHEAGVPLAACLSNVNLCRRTLRAQGRTALLNFTSTSSHE